MKLSIAWLCCFLSTTAVLAQESDPTADQTNAAAASDVDLLQGQLLAPKAFRAAAAKVLPSLVTIESFGGLSSGTTKGAIGGIRKPGDGPTTGLIISEDGYVITSSFNFIRQQPIITVVMHDGARHVAKLLGRDETRKLCILKIEDAAGLPVPEHAVASKLRVGQWAISVGVGFGDSETAISAGVISARNRISGRAVQTDANISPANYGGPLIDIEGRVIGICVPLNPQSQETGAGVEWYDSGIGFAVPLDGAESVIAAMKAGKIVQPAQLGVQVEPGGDKGGVIVKKVLPDSAAGKADIKEGDRIVRFEDQPVSDAQQLRTLIGKHAAGDVVKVTLDRESMTVDVEVELAVAAKAKSPDKPELPFKLPIPKRGG
jgi:serine protease Do